MVITYYGLSCFKIQSGETVLGIDPPAKDSGLKAPRFESHVALISHNHKRHNGRDALNAKDGKLLLIENPGEYEIRGVFINGIPSFHDAENGKKHGLNAVYKIEMEEIIVAHLGDFGEKTLRTETQEELGNIDVLIVPIGGDTVMDAETAAEITNRLAPKIVIPMHFESSGKKDKSKSALEIFLAEMGQEEMTPQDKFTTKKKDLPEKTQVVVLKPII